MNRIAELYDRWMKAEHLTGPVMARVISAEIVQFDSKNGKESKYCLHFHQRQLKPLVLNKGNATAMVKVTGTDDERQWCNVVVMLTPSTLANGNGTVILSAPPAQSAAAPATAISAGPEEAEEEEREIPF